MIVKKFYKTKIKIFDKQMTRKSNKNYKKYKKSAIFLMKKPVTNN